jgi:O-antigen ligase
MTKDRIIKILNLFSQLLILAVVFFVPLFFAGFFFINNFFELPKIVLFKILTLLLLLVYILKILFQDVPKLSLRGPANWAGTKSGLPADRNPEAYANTAGSFAMTKSEFIFPIALILILFCQTFLFSVNINNSIFGLYDRQQGLISLVYYFLFFCLFIKIVKTEQLNKILSAIVWSALLVSIYGIAQRFGWDFVRWTESASLTHRIFSTQGQPIFLASYLVLTLPISLYLFFMGKSRLASIFYFIASVLQIAALLLTYSFGGVVGLSLEEVLIFVFLLFYLHKNKIEPESKMIKLKLYSSFLVLAALFSGFLFYNLRYDWVLSSKVASLMNWQGSSAQMRTIYWQDSLLAIKDRPWFGYGLENQGQALIKYYDQKWAELEFVNMPTNRAHNIFLDIILTSGWLGLILFLWSLYSLAKIVLNNWKKNEEEYKLLSVFLGIAIMALLLNLQFSFMSVTLGAYLALLSGILLVINKQTAKLPSENLAAGGKLMMVIKIIIGCGAVVICSYLIDLNFNKIISDSYFREMRTVDRENNFFAAVDLYDYIKTNIPEYNYYDQQLVEMINNDTAHWSDPGANISYIKDRLEKIIKNNPAKTFFDILTQARAYAMLSIIGKEQGSFNRSKSLYEEIIKFSLGLPRPQYELAVLLARAKDYDGAKKQYSIFLSKLPDADSPDMNSEHRQAVVNEMVKGYIGLGDVFAEQKDWTAASKNYQQAITVEPKDSLVYYKIGRLYYLQHDFKQAIWYNNKASELDPSNYFYPYITAVFYKEMGNKSEAKNYAQQALKLNSRAPEALELVWELGK